MKKVINASIARIILSLLLIIILSAEVGKMQTEAATVDAKIQSLLASKSQLNRNSDIANKAKNIVSESKLYQYQNQIIQDLNTYADRAGIPIKSFTFQNEPAAAAVKTATPSAKQPSTNPSGTKSTFVSIQLGDSIDYTKFLHFLNLIEKNVTRMQLSGVSISRGANKHEISIQALEVKVYTR